MGGTGGVGEGENRGVMGAGSVREAGEGRVGEEVVGDEIPKGAKARRKLNSKSFWNIAQYFTIGKAHRIGNHYRRGWEPLLIEGGGNQEYMVWEEGSLIPPPPPPPLTVIQITLRQVGYP